MREVPTYPQPSQVIRDPDTWTVREASLGWLGGGPHRRPLVK
jgi:hypothetical protein